MGDRRRRWLAAARSALSGLLVLPAGVAAHPLGTSPSTTAGVRAEPNRIQLDIVIDEAEIPAFQSRLGFDTDDEAHCPQSALLILLGSVAANRPAFGFVLVVAFGLGMAVVMGGIGLALVLARGRLDRVEAASPLSRLGADLPPAAWFVDSRVGPVPGRAGGRGQYDVLTIAAARGPLLGCAAHEGPDRSRPGHGYGAGGGIRGRPPRPAAR